MTLYKDYQEINKQMKSLEKKSEPSLNEAMMVKFPTFYVNGEQMPEIKKWKVGETYNLQVTVRMNSYGENQTLMHEHCFADLAIESYEVKK